MIQRSALKAILPCMSYADITNHTNVSKLKEIRD